MHDLTQGPVRRHLIAMAVPIAIGMLMQTLYYLVDLYFVGAPGRCRARRRRRRRHASCWW